MSMDIMYAKAAACLGAAIAMGIGGIGPALGQGLVGMKACENIGKYGEHQSKIRGAMILALSIIETTALYALGIACALMYFAFTLQ